MTDQLPPLDNELAALIAQAGPVRPPMGTAEKVWRGLDLAPLAIPVAAVGLEPVARGLAGIKLGGALVVALTVGAVAGIAVDRTLVKGPPEVRVVTKEVRIEVPVVAPAPLPDPEVPTPLQAVLKQVPKRVLPEPAAVIPTAPPVADLDVQLKEERAILEVARTALARGEAQQALDGLSQHAARFPQGRLSEERDALVVTALNSLGRVAEARQKADAFLKAYPESLLGSQVRKILREAAP